MKNLLNTITYGNSFELIHQIDDHSIDLILTDPPYFLNSSGGFKGKEWDSSKSLLDVETTNKIEYGTLTKKQAREEYLNAVENYFIHMTNVLLPKLKVDGTLIIFNRKHNLDTINNVLQKDTFTLEEWQRFPLSNQQSEPNSRWYTTYLEWKKTNPNTKIHKRDWSEYALIASNMTKSNPEKIAQIPQYWDDNLNSDNQYYATSPYKSKTIFYEKSNHVSPKPISLWADLIKRFTNPNDIVLDIYSGSGTTAMVAEDLNRQYIAFEYEQEQVERSLDRLKKFKENMPHSVFPFKN
ncbi:site-specific DNA-methyltransferase [Enterococcus sp. BWB1-3]|uniref:DNA-methyltransferase n=1 Tax=Enterococcus sp. BWB1-3 TaxID=2787713 RepID=UPI0019244A27|nr:site-specific DNA-methyltransferase [Enterococcus sp. BWB1-3]MBL1228019.1 site-specific DNA-methyltransferase [Enterococcus sp. BWB1-3]